MHGHHVYMFVKGEFDALGMRCFGGKYLSRGLIL